MDDGGKLFLAGVTVYLVLVAWPTSVLACACSHTTCTEIRQCLCVQLWRHDALRPGASPAACCSARLLCCRSSYRCTLAECLTQRGRKPLNADIVSMPTRRAIGERPTHVLLGVARAASKHVHARAGRSCLPSWGLVLCSMVPYVQPG